MINWMNLAANTLWILGCAAALAILSYANWRALLMGIKMRTILVGYQHQIVLNLSCVLPWTGCCVCDANWENFYLGAAGCLVRCPNVNNNPQK